MLNSLLQKIQSSFETPSQRRGSFHTIYEQPLSFVKIVNKPVPFGWLSEPDMDIIFTAAMATCGSMLEIGPYLGRSTTVIAEAKLRNPSLYQFDTIDFFPENDHEWKILFEELGWSEPVSEVVEIWKAGGLEYNFKKNVNEYIENKTIHTIIKGNFRTVKLPLEKYDCIFCDATHSIDEISMNMTRLKDLASPKCTLLFHDIANEDMQNFIINSFSFTHYYASSYEKTGSSIFIGTYQ